MIELFAIELQDDSKSKTSLKTAYVIAMPNVFLVCETLQDTAYVLREKNKHNPQKIVFVASEYTLSEATTDIVTAEKIISARCLNKDETLVAKVNYWPGYPLLKLCNIVSNKKIFGAVLTDHARPTPASCGTVYQAEE